MDENDSSSPTDEELLAAYRGGDLAAFEALLARHEAALLRFAGRYHPASAQDVVQETFLRLIRERDALTHVENLSAWLWRVARNLSIDHSRKERRMIRRERAVAVPEGVAPGPSAVEREETVDLVTSKLLGLPEKQRDVLILKIQERKSYREISEITGLTVSYVGYLIHHGIRNLANELRAAGVI